MDYRKFFNTEIKKFKDEGLYREFRNIDRPIKSFPSADEKVVDTEREVEVWCSNENPRLSLYKLIQ